MILQSHSQIWAWGIRQRSPSPASQGHHPYCVHNPIATQRLITGALSKRIGVYGNQMSKHDAPKVSGSAGPDHHLAYPSDDIFNNHSVPHTSSASCCTHACNVEEDATEVAGAAAGRRRNGDMRKTNRRREGEGVLC